MTTIFGLDFSHYDALPAGARVVAEGFSFFTHKAGGDANDPELGAWWQAMKPHRDEVELGAYWVLRRVDGKSAADAFLARLDAQCPGWRDGPFILQLDCESWNSGNTPAPTKAQIKACADRLREKMPKLMPFVYAPKWVYGSSLTGLGYPLWASSYVSGSGSATRLYPGDNSSHWSAYSGQTPAILQFSSSATALGQTTCDVNAYRGTLTELLALTAPGWEIDMTTVDLTPAAVTAVAAALKKALTEPAAFTDAAGGNHTALSDALLNVAQIPGADGKRASVWRALAAAAQQQAAPVIPQEQLDLAVLNALKTLAGGKA